MIILDRSTNCRASNEKTAIIVGNSINKIGTYNSKRTTL